MPRDVPTGNGSMLVAFDANYFLRELYFPHVGQENHTNGEPFRFGVWIEGKFSWLSSEWEIKKDYVDDSCVTKVELISQKLQIRITVNDAVDFHENIYFRKFLVENLAGQEREVRLFLAHDFHIYGNDIGDTAEFRPENSSLLHYKAERYFLINVYANNKYGVERFATGNKETEQFEGTWKDAEDGVLSNNPIAQGSVDSVLAIHLPIEANGSKTCFYWIAAGHNWAEVKSLHDLVRKKGPEIFFKRTLDYWHLWVNKEPITLGLFPPKVHELYKKSLLIARTQINNFGSIIAANDSDVMHFNRDTYSYMWPRDGALVANAFDMAGYQMTRNFYNLCNKIIEKGGYFLHKYTPSGSLASSWHPWVQGEKVQLPIQEDETALVIWALWQHYALFRDVEFIKPLYKTLIKRAADFMMNYRDPKTGLPLSSYDLWEERLGIHTFTVSAVYGGLIAAANFTKEFGEVELSAQYYEGALRIKEAMDLHLYVKAESRFARTIFYKEDGTFEVDLTVDASLYGLFAFGVYTPTDEKVKNTMQQVYDKLWNHDIGGLCRYENDSYYRENATSKSNPWFVTTLWMAQYYIACAKTKEDLQKPLSILSWVADHALPSGVLSEQIDARTCKPLSVSPLTWSHGTFIATAQHYLNKLLEIEQCPTCHRSKFSKT